MVAGARGIALSAADRSRILQGMLTLPAHPDVRDGLQTMRDAGLRLVTLTNSAPAAVQQQLTNAGLTAFFSSRDRGRSCIRSARSRTSLDRIFGASQTT